MKKSLLIIAIFMMLAATTAKVFAQTNTPTTPAEGGTFNYVIGGLTDGDTYIWGISTAANDYTTTAGDYTVTSTPALGATGTVAGTSATLTVTWTTGASGDNYWVWIEVIDNAGCSTFRALPVNPTDALPSYVVNFNVEALSVTGDEATTPGAITGGAFVVNATGTCPTFVDEKWIADNLADNTMNDGNSYVYFRVTRTSSAPVTASGWSITPTVSTATAWEVSTDASAWTTMNATQSVLSGIDVLYLRATVLNATESQLVSLNIGETTHDAGGLRTDANTIGSNVATKTILPLPTVGTFGGSN